jgi:DASH complex subunit DAD1
LIHDTQVGNEFSSVEALWSQFENFMGRSEENEQNGTRQGEEQHDGEEGRDGHDQSFAEGESTSH